MITTVLFIRHGVTDWNVAGRWQGHTDIPLNDDGHVQACKLAQRLADWPIKAIYTSDLRRAQETANVLAKKLNLTPVIDDNFRERNGGVFQGLTIEQLNNRHGDAWHQVRHDGSAPPNGESMLEVGIRAYSSFEKISSGHLGETVAIVSHGGTLNILISHLIGLPLGQPASISLRGNTGLSIVEIDDSGPRLTLLNDVSHLSTGRKDIESGFSILTATE